MAVNPLWRAPELRRDEDENKERKVGFLELFFDLVFVVVIAELAHSLAAHTSWSGVGAFALLFVPAWWLWIGFTFYTERFETLDVSFRVATWLYMIPVAALAVFAHDAMGATSVGFALSYAAGRTLLILFWLRGGHHNPVARPMTRRFAVGFGASVALFVASVFVPAPARFVLWGVALAIDVVTPMFTRRQQEPLPRFSSSRVPERFGLFTIIVLGESIVGVVAGVADVHDLTLAVGVTALLGLALAFGVWWVYFDIVARHMARPGMWWAMARSYLHLPVMGGITAIGAGVLHAVASGGGALDAASRALLAGATAVTCLGLAALIFVLDQSRSDARTVRVMNTWFVIAGVIAAALAFPVAVLTAPVLLAVLVVLFVGPIVHGAVHWSRGAFH